MVAPAQLDMVDAHLARRGVDQALHEVVRFGPPGAAIGADRRRVREHHLGRDLDQRRAVDGCEIARDAHRAHRGADIGEVGAEIGVAIEPHGEEGAVLVERQLGVEVVVAAVLVAEEGAAAIVGPFDRTAEQLRGMEEPGIFGVGRALHAERAADIAGEDAHLCRLDVQQGGHLVLEAEGALIAGIERVAIGLGVVVADRRARLHRADDDAVADEPQARDVRRLGEGLGDLGAVAIVEVDADIARHVVEHQRRARLRGLARVGDGGQCLDIEHHGFGGIARLSLGLRDDESHGIAHEAHLVGGERGPYRRLHRRAVAIGHRHDGLQRAVAGEIRAGPDTEHARHRPGFGRVDALDQTVRHLAAHHHAIDLIFELDVVAVATLALQQGRVFLARHGLADAEFHQVEGIGGKRRVHGDPLERRENSPRS